MKVIAALLECPECRGQRTVMDWTRLSREQKSDELGSMTCCETDMCAKVARTMLVDSPEADED